MAYVNMLYLKIYKFILLDEVKKNLQNTLKKLITSNIGSWQLKICEWVILKEPCGMIPF